MMDEEIRQALTEVREMKKMCGNINMKLTNIVTQRGQDIQKKLDAEYQRGLEDGKAVHDKGCEGCKYGGTPQGDTPCYNCSNYYKNNWTAKDEKIGVGDVVKTYNGITFVVTRVTIDGTVIGFAGEGSTCRFAFSEVTTTGRHFDIASILEEMRK